MDKYELMEKAEAVFMEGLEMIDSDPVHGEERAQEYWDRQREAWCSTDQEREWWDIGFTYGNESSAAKLKEWQRQFAILNDAFKKVGLPQELRAKMIQIWSGWYIENLDEVQKA